MTFPYYHSALSKHVSDRSLTSLAGAGPVACASAIADKPVPSLFTQTLVLAGVAFTLLARHLVTRRLDASSVLGLRYLPDVLTTPVDEQVPNATHVTIVQHGGPQLSG